MGFLDRLLGREDRSAAGRGAPYGQQHAQTGYRTDHPASGQPVSRTQHASQPKTDDERAVERYRYLLKTAPPEQLEQAHAEAFAKLTPEQRRQVLAELSEQVPASERAQSDSPRDLARMATRAEVRQPGTLERSFSGGAAGGRGLGMGAMIGGGLLAGVAGAFVGTAIADAMFDDFDGQDYAEGFQDGVQADDGGASDAVGDAGYDDGGGFDGGGFDGGGDFGGFDV